MLRGIVKAMNKSGFALPSQEGVQEGASNAQGPSHLEEALQATVSQEDEEYRSILPKNTRDELMEAVQDEDLLNYVKRLHGDLNGGAFIDAVLNTLLGEAK